MFEKPQQEHEWLAKMVGQWTMEGECTMGPDQPPSKSTGTEVVRSLGGLWVVGEGEGEGPDGTKGHTMIITLGYDPLKGKYVGSFFGSMMTFLWLYEGTLDATGKILTLDTEGPSVAHDGSMAKYHDIIEWIDDDHRTLSSEFQGEDGQWHRFMTAHYYRKK